MRNWNDECDGEGWIITAQVFSLPMRNWNFFHHHQTSPFPLVFSLPMRNWNIFLIFRRSFHQQFLAYLWGIETLRPCNRTRKQTIRVFSLPMRNWNLSNSFCIFLAAAVFSLPMRNWNQPRPKLEHLPPTVFSLPMRNWNLAPNTDYKNKHAVFSLPMRNWNISCFIVQL